MKNLVIISNIILIFLIFAYQFFGYDGSVTWFHFPYSWNFEDQEAYRSELIVFYLDWASLIVPSLTLYYLYIIGDLKVFSFNNSPKHPFSNNEQ